MEGVSIMYDMFSESNARKAFNEKNMILDSYYLEYSAKEFYSYVFPSNTIESRDKTEGKPNPIYSYQVYKTDKEGNYIYTEKISREGIKYKYKKSYMCNKIMTNAYDFEKDYRDTDFIVCGLYTSWGKSRGSKHAYLLYGFAFDIDGVGVEQLNSILYGIQEKVYPTPTFIVNSGHGIHLYYIFEQPIPLYPKFVNTLNRLKTGLTWELWNKETTDERAGKRQFQSIYQGMRMIGSPTKFAKGTKKSKYHLRAWKVGDRVDLTYLNEFVLPEFKMRKSERDYSSLSSNNLSLEQAKELYPDWYHRRIELGEEQGRYYCNRGLYDWFLNKLKTDKDLKDGHRYYAVGCLFVYAIKCNIPYEEVEQDAIDLIPYLDSLTQNPGNEFTIDDVMSASAMYEQKWVRMSREFVEHKTALDCRSHSRRNGRTQKEHLQRARTLRALSSYENVGRPSMQDIVENYYKDNPSASVRKAAADLGIGKSTVARWRP